MNLSQFISWAINAVSVATPIGTYVGECVSLIQQYLAMVFGIPFQARGHAKDWATNANVLSYFDKVSSPQAGDIGISGPTASNPYGHIWLYTSSNTIIEQNGRVARKVSTGSPYLNPIAILRRKGTATDMIEKDNFAQLRVVNSEVKGWDVNQTHAGAFDAREIAAWAGQPWVKFIQQAWEEGEGYRTQKALWQSFYNQYKDIVGELSKRPTTAELQAVVKKLSEAEAKAQLAAEEAAKLKLEQTEDTQLLNEGGSWLQKLFNRLFKKG